MSLATLEGRRTRLLAEAAEIARVRSSRLTSGHSRLREMELRSISSELGMALRTNDRTMQRHLADAEQAVRLFPASVDALITGRIDRPHLDAIIDAGCVIVDSDVRAAFERVILERAATDTPARTRAFGRRLAEQVHPRSIEELFREAEGERAITVTEVADGMAELRALLPVTVAFGILDRLTRQAKAIEGATGAEAEWADERSRDQIRADIFADILLTGAPTIDPVADLSPGGLGAIRAHVQISVPVTTLTGVTSGGCELDGRAPVDAGTARRLAGDAPGWDRVMTDPVKGTVLEVDRYEPVAAQQRFLRARDVHCRHPGCRQAVRRCQIDHNHERQHGGRTCLGNLAHLCVRHHTMKTETEWTVRQLPGGSSEWTSPLGFTYRDDPPSRVVFVPDATPPPF